MNPTPTAVVSGLDRVAGRIRRLYLTAGVARLVAAIGGVAILAYTIDRWLHLPLAVRAAALLLLLVLLVREFRRCLWGPLTRGPERLDAARIVEGAVPEFEGRLIAALQLGGGADGSMAGRMASEAEDVCRRTDLLGVLTNKPTLRVVWSALGVVALCAVLVATADPALGVFVQRWTLQDVPWPRDTHLHIMLPERGPAHVVLEDSSLVVARGGVIDVRAAVDGLDPAGAEIVIDTDRGERVLGMTVIDGIWRGHFAVQAGDESLSVRGGDDRGDENRRVLSVMEPPRLESPRFRLQPPEYLGRPDTEVGPEGLVVPEGTRVGVGGEVRGQVTRAELWMLGTGAQQALEIDTSGDRPRVDGAFTADASGSLAVVLTGPHGLQTPDPAHHALLVQPDRPPTLRVFAPSRSTVKVTPRAVVPFAVVADDDHGVDHVALLWDDDSEGPAFTADANEAGHFRWVLDLATDAGRLGAAVSDGRALSDQVEPGTIPTTYTVMATDGRSLPDRGPQSARVDGRRLDIVETAEVQRLLADRQLRLKEAYSSVRERQQRVSESVVAMLEVAPGSGDPDLVAAVVAQNQVTVRLRREARELASIVDDTVFNRLDAGPGAESVLQRRLDDWSTQPVDEPFTPGVWQGLSDDYAGGRFGRLDQIGRLLDMLALALELSETLSPKVHETLSRARAEPSPELLTEVAAGQQEIEALLDRLLGRMDEWEDYQEVLSLVKTLIEDQELLRKRTEDALREERETP